MDLLNRYIAIGNEFGSLMTDLLIESRDDHPELVSMIGDHFEFSVNRSNSIYALLQSACFWDAEIVARPLVECTVRACFVCYAPSDLRDQLIKEHYHYLYEINKLEQSERAKKSRTAIPAEERGRILMDGLVLSDEEEEDIRSRWPKKSRKALKQKWSFSEMVRALSERIEPHFDKDIFSAFIHSYGVSSHLIHADESGIGLEKDRNRRVETERVMMNQAHFYNLLDLTLVSSMLMTVGLSVALKSRIEEAAVLVEKFNSVHAHKEPVVDQLVDKWRHMYKKLDM